MSLLPGITAYRIAEQSGAKGLQKFQDRPEIQQEIQRFKTSLKDIKTVDDFYQNERAYRFVLESANLGSDIPYRGKVKRLLGQSHLDKESLMFKLTDERFAKLAEKLQFAERGVNRLKLGFVSDQIINDFVKQRYEQSLGEQNAGVPLARYFRENIGAVKSEYGILGDSKLREVVLTTLGIPKQFAVLPVESQAEAIKNRLNLGDFKKEDFTNRFIQKFLSANDQQTQKTSGGGSYMLALFGRSNSSGSINLNLLV